MVMRAQRVEQRAEGEVTSGQGRGVTFTAEESFAEPLRFTNELRLRRAGDRFGEALSSTPLTGHSLGILTAAPNPRRRSDADAWSGATKSEKSSCRGCRLAHRTPMRNLRIR